MNTWRAADRQQRAIEAAKTVAAAHHVISTEPFVLKDSNNTVIHLAPCPVVAKVSASTLIPERASTLEHELSVALYLADMGAPIVPPSSDIPPAVYRHGDCEITFWQFCQGDIREEIDSDALVATVGQFHAALSDYPGTLKPFTDEYQDCCTLLNSDRISAELSSDDRRFLLEIYDQLAVRLSAIDYRTIPVHTDIHGGNLLWTKDRPMLIDFETCCRGPRELDFLFLSESRLSMVPDLDKQLMDILGHLASFRVSVWCWLQPDRAPEVREAAEYHLNRLHSIYGEHLGHRTRRSTRTG